MSHRSGRFLPVFPGRIQPRNWFDPIRQGTTSGGNGMNLRRNVALLFLVLVLAAGLASAQNGVKVSQVNTGGAVTTTTVNMDGTNGGPSAKAPTGGANGTYKYWDVLGTGGTSTNY